MGEPLSGVEMRVAARLAEISHDKRWDNVRSAVDISDFSPLESLGIASTEAWDVALNWCDDYSVRLQREACGVFLQTSEKWGGNVAWHGVRNVAADRHKFVMERADIERLENAARKAEIDGDTFGFRAVLHSHPWAEFGSTGWVGPSLVDVDAARRAALGGSELRNFVWLPKLKQVVEYGSEGILCKIQL